MTKLFASKIPNGAKLAFQFRQEEKWKKKEKIPQQPYPNVMQAQSRSLVCIDNNNNKM